MFKAVSVLRSRWARNTSLCVSPSGSKRYVRTSRSIGVHERSVFAYRWAVDVGLAARLGGSDLRKSV
eukprot:4493811-Prymnesium_polylepis.1